MQLHGCLIHGFIQDSWKNQETWDTFKNFEKIQPHGCVIHGYIHEFWKKSMKTNDTYMNFEKKIQWKQSFHHQLTKVNCIKSNNTKKTNPLS